MKLSDILKEMSLYKAQDIEHTIKDSFLNLGILLKFSNHFTDRLVSTELDKNGFSRDNISEEELFDVFKKLKKHHNDLFKEIKDHTDEVKKGKFEGVIREIFKNINIPFALSYDSKLNKFVLTCKTIMKKEKGSFFAQKTDHVIEV